MPSRFCSRLLARNFALSLGFCLYTTAAHADLKLCNATSSRVGVAIGYQDNSGLGDGGLVEHSFANM